MMSNVTLSLFRALVAEALEISSFMACMGDANNNEELRELAMGDWARYEWLGVQNNVKYLLL